MVVPAEQVPHHGAIWRGNAGAAIGAGRLDPCLDVVQTTAEQPLTQPCLVATTQHFGITGSCRRSALQVRLIIVTEQSSRIK